jgi:transcriptional regulator with XRE-family HTH domain
MIIGMTTAGHAPHWKPRDTLANRLRLLRAELGLSQREFGKRCQIPASQIQSIEDGNSPRALDAKVKKIVLAFGVDRDWLIWGGELDAPDGPGPGGSLLSGLNRRPHAYLVPNRPAPMREAA